MNASQLCEPILSFSCFIIYRSQSNSQTKANDYKYRVPLIRCAHVRVHAIYIVNVNAVCLAVASAESGHRATVTCEQAVGRHWFPRRRSGN